MKKKKKVVRKVKPLVKKVKPKKDVSPPVSLSDINEKIIFLQNMVRENEDRYLFHVNGKVTELNKSNIELFKMCNELLLKTRNTVDLSNEIIRIERIIVKNIERINPEAIIDSCKIAINQKAFRIFDQITATLDKLNTKINTDHEKELYDRLRRKYEKES